MTIVFINANIQKYSITDRVTIESAKQLINYVVLNFTILFDILNIMITIYLDPVWSKKTYVHNIAWSTITNARPMCSMVLNNPVCNNIMCATQGFDSCASSTTCYVQLRESFYQMKVCTCAIGNVFISTWIQLMFTQTQLYFLFEICVF